MSFLKDDVHLAERLNEDEDARCPLAGVILFGSVGVAEDDDIPESDENCLWPVWLPTHLTCLSIHKSSSSLADENVSSMYETNRDSESLAMDRSGVDGGVCGNEHADRRSASFAHSSSMSDVDIRSDERRNSSNGKHPPIYLEVFSLW